jgi:hypothetical protein
METIQKLLDIGDDTNNYSNKLRYGLMVIKGKLYFFVGNMKNA